MDCYIVFDKGLTYYRTDKGIFKKNMKSLAPPQAVVLGKVRDFSLLFDKETHIIFADEYNNIYYLKEGRAPTLIIKGKAELPIYDLTWRGIGMTDFYYQTKYESEALLLKCRLNDNSSVMLIGKPKMNTSFCVSSEDIYFLKTDGKVVKNDLETIAEKCEDFFACSILGKEFFAKLQEDLLIVNEKKIVRGAKSPIIFKAGKSVILEWQTNSGVFYSKYIGKGHWGEPKKYIADKSLIHKAGFFLNGEYYTCYAVKNIPLAELTEANESDIAKRLSYIKKEIEVLKKELEKLQDMNYFN